MRENSYVPLFETKPQKRFIPFQLTIFVPSIFASICFIFVYRWNYMPIKEEKSAAADIHCWVWIGLCLSDIWFFLYWLVTVVVRLNPVIRYTFKDRLSLRYEKVLPRVDIYVCTANPRIEPPIMVINTVLSVMAYKYPSDKLAIYLSDDGGSDLTFYALLEASRFSKEWLPFCNKYKVEPPSPEAYFRITSSSVPVLGREDWTSVKNLYEDMKIRIETTTRTGRISQAIRKQHKGFCEWNFVSSPNDHQTILQILIDGRDPNAVDIEGKPLPTLVYLAREKRPQYHHHFKAGAMNALIRVSSRISNAPIILNVDCDMYSNNSDSIRDALCFLLDEEKGHEIAFVQFPQTFENHTKNDLYSTYLQIGMEVEFPGLDGNGGACYIGTGCFHKRASLCGLKYRDATKEDWRIENDRKIEESADELEQTCKVLASCSFEQNTEWGKEMGLKYGCMVEDVITGLAIHCRGWKSVYFSPQRTAFLGLATTSLHESLVQHKRWSVGNFQIFLSHCSLIYGYKNMPLKLQISYLIYSLWAPCCLPTLYYAIVPSLCLLRGIPLFPKLTDHRVLPFIYVFFCNRVFGLVEYVSCGGTFHGWLNEQRMWLYRRTTSYFFGFCECIFKLFGFASSAFVITSKVADDGDVYQRYEQEIMEFGTTSPMFTILATLALLNAFSFYVGLKRLIFDEQSLILNPFVLQTVLSGLLVFINVPVYQGLFLRKDKGRMPISVTCQSILITLAVCWVNIV